MKIANLLEATGPVIAFSWGRFQPPHLGHAQVFKKVASVGKDGYWICTSQSKDPKKNPLDYDTKIALLKEMFPQYADHILYDPKVKTIYDAIVSIYNKMDPKAAEQTTLVFVGDPERIGDFQEGFRKYNGVQMRGGYYKFKDVTTFPNTDAADIRATDVRGAASSGDFNKFMQLTGTKGALAKKVYNAVRAGMGVDNKKLKEDIGYNFYELIKGPAMLNLYDKMHHAKMKNKDMLKYVLDNIWYMKKIDPKTLRSIRQKFYQDPFGRNLHIDQKQIQHYIDLMKHYQNIDPVVIGPSGSIIDGNHRVRAAAELGQPIVAYVAVNENVAEKDLDVPTPTVQDLAKKYRKTVKQVNIELAKGIKVEMEHTTDVEVAREIALDHLNEKLDYYTELAKVEKDESLAEAWSKKYKKSINCSNPKGFSQRAHCAGRKARRAGKNTKSGSVSEDVINELANEPYRYMLWKRTMMGNSYLFQTDSGQEIVVSMVPETLADGTHRVEVMFADKATFGLEKTGKGDAFRIFATVAQILKDYIKEAKFEVGEIYFTGKTKEPSRIKLYDKIARRLGQHIPGFEFYGAGDNSVEKGYIFKKTDGEQVKEEVIDEVSMSPGSLKKFAATDFAKSMTVGFEAEMVIEGMEDEDGEVDYEDIEPDWDMDEVVSFNGNWRQQVTRFFTGGDWGSSRRDVEMVMEKIDEEYFEWISEQYQEWLDSDESRDTIVKFLKDYDSDISDEAIEDTVKFKKNNYWGSIENDVREDWEADNMGDDSFREFMEYAEYDTMRGIFDKFYSDLNWPYMTEPEYSGGGGGGVTFEDVESDFVEKTGYTATVSRGYHATERKPGLWIFEPDSSIRPPGVELVSPPMPLDEGLKALDDFFNWAKGYGAEANKSTGFHMGVSIPEQTMDNVDHLKLILFLGDEYVLQQFGRSSNSYTKSSLDAMRGQLRSPSTNIQDVLNKFKEGLNSEAAKVARGRMIPRGDRFVSVNIKSNYVEFRSAGGNYFEKIPEIKNTMLRYVRAMSVAADPEAEKQEYAKKLYKLMSTAFPDDLDSIKYFSNYAAGTMTRSELKGAVSQVQQKRAAKKLPPEPLKKYEIYLIGTDYVFHTFDAHNDEEANDIATDWARQRNKTDWDVRLSTPRPLPGSTPGVVPGSTADRAQQRAAAADPTLTTYSAKYRDQNGIEGRIGITASNYSQAQEQYMNLRRAYPHISFIGLQTNPQEGKQTNEEEIDRVPGGWKHYKKAFGRPSTIEPLPRWETFQNRVRNKKGSWEDIVHYMTFLTKDYRTSGINDLTGDEIAKYICADAKTNPKKSLADFNAYRTKKGLDNFDSWTDLYDAIRDFERERKYSEIVAVAKRRAGKQTNESLDEMLKKVKGKWALVSRQNPEKVLQYYHGSGHPSKEWVNKVERRVQSFKHMEEAEEMKPAIFIDMDGTIADFFGEWAKLDNKDHYKDIEHKEDALDLVRNHPTFWVDLPLLPNARELVKAAIDLYGEYYICSKPLEHDPRSAPGKLAWIQKHFGDMPPKDVFFTDNKGAYAQMGGRPNVLIDDFGKYVDSWKAAGGIAIKYRPERFPEVVELLRKLAK